MINNYNYIYPATPDSHSQTGKTYKSSLPLSNLLSVHPSRLNPTPSRSVPASLTTRQGENVSLLPPQPNLQLSVVHLHVLKPARQSTQPVPRPKALCSTTSPKLNPPFCTTY